MRSYHRNTSNHSLFPCFFLFAFCGILEHGWTVTGKPAPTAPIHTVVSLVPAAGQVGITTSSLSHKRHAQISFFAGRLPDIVLCKKTRRFRCFKSTILQEPLEPAGCVNGYRQMISINGGIYRNFTSIHFLAPHRPSA
ncbi:hypothetical protein F5Y05DRAFT_209399 [Hypoxylon sp. FL0543]|nr:hypothetical protein F5Y05DRAFT_209399 [Hypoxylon sp. FL0543]